MTPDEAASVARAAARRQMHRFAIDLEALLVPGTEMDPWAAALLMGRALSDAPPDQVQTMREWPLTRWVEEIARAASVVGDEPPVGPPREPPALPAPPAPPPTPSAGTALIPAPPRDLPPELHEAWIQARTRAGEYARGLGNVVEEDTGAVVAEVWSGEDVEEVDAEARARTMRIIREETSDAIAEGQTAQKLASRLGNATGRWGRDWERVARTELRGAVSEGAVIHAVRTWGDEARVARVPDADACANCRRLTLDESGRPRIFTVEELLANGSNVGKKADAWSVTLWPIHPRCLCDTATLPPGYEFDASWDLVPSQASA